MTGVKAVILAAGMGLRLRPRTETSPKGLLEIDGKTLLERSLAALLKAGITETIIVIGYLKEMIRDRFGERFGGMSLRYVCNEEYATKGSMRSFQKAREMIGTSDALLLESDLLYDERLIRGALDAHEDTILMVSPPSGSGDEVYVCVDQRGRLVALGKQLPEALQQQACGEMVGISRFSAPFLVHLFETAEDDYVSGKRLFHYEECVLRTALKGSPVYTLYTNLPWTEIDCEADLKRAREYIYPRLPVE